MKPFVSDLDNKNLYPSLANFLLIFTQQNIHNMKKQNICGKYSERQRIKKNLYLSINAQYEPTLHPVIIPTENVCPKKMSTINIVFLHSCISQKAFSFKISFILFISLLDFAWQKKITLHEDLVKNMNVYLNGESP